MYGGDGGGGSSVGENGGDGGFGGGAGGAGGIGGVEGGVGAAQILKPVSPDQYISDEKVKAVVVTPSGPLVPQYRTPSTLTALSYELPSQVGELEWNRKTCTINITGPTKLMLHTALSCIMRRRLE